MPLRMTIAYLFSLGALMGSATYATLPFTGPGEVASPEILPLQERALRLADTLLLEPGYRRARLLAREWHRFVTGFVNDEKLLQQLEDLANDRAILYLLREPEGELSPVFAKESERILNDFGNGALLAWQLRSIAGKTILAHNAERLKDRVISEVRREVNPRFFSLPISGANYNFILDAEWDITRLSSFPVNEAASEFLFIQTDEEQRLIGRTELRKLPDSALRFISGDKFIATPYLVQNGMRVIAVQGGNLRLFICYPFAGYLFYTVRGLIALLMLVGLILVLRGIRLLLVTAKNLLENRQGRWLGEHYEKSLSLNEQALKVSDRSVALISEIKERDAKLISELGRKLGEITAGIEEQTRFLIEEAVAKKSVSTPAKAVKPQKQSPLYRKHIPKAPILIDATAPADVQVSIELDLPLKDEKEIAPQTKANYISSLRRRASEKAGQREFVHDEKIDNFDYTPEEPMPLPQKPAWSEKESPESADLEYVQKFRYAPAQRVLPLAIRPRKAESLRIREDLNQQQLLITGEEE